VTGTSVKLGRPIGAYGTYKCRVCGTKERARGGSQYFRCSSCRTSINYSGKYFLHDHGGAGAMAQVCGAIKSGALKHPTQFKCSDCGNKAVEYDHRDYNRPLEVDPVCRSCNLRRGPAIPKKGYFQFAFQNNHPPYRNKSAALKLFSLLGIEVDSTSFPGSTDIEHWLPYREALIATELCTNSPEVA